MFRNEREMVNAFVDVFPTLEHWSSDSLYALSREVQLNGHVADIMIAKICRDDLVVLEQLRNLVRLNMVELDVLSSFATDNSVSIHRLASRLGISAPQVHSDYLEGLVDMDLVTRSSRYTYSATGWRELLPESIWAIEFKLNKWRETVGQAAANAPYVDYSLVALETSYFERATATITDFQAKGLGLLTISESREVILVLPPRRTCNPTFRAFQQLRILRDLVRGGRWIVRSSPSSYRKGARCGAC